MKFISRIVPYNNNVLTRINRNIIIQAVLKNDKNDFTYYDIVSVNGLNNHLLKLFYNNNFIFTNVTTAVEKSFIKNDLLRDENTVYNLYMDLDIIINNFENNKAYMYGTIYSQQIDMASNTVEEPVYADGSWGYSETMSSVVTITIDGKEVESCGSTMLFAEDGLNSEVDFKSPEFIESETSGSIKDYTFIAGIVNKVKNNFGKNRVVVIQSQLGDPICAYSGDEVYWKVCKDLPKTTKLMIDGKALYIHRANFQIIDKSLLN